MAKYRKKPVEIEAIQWTGENQRENVRLSHQRRKERRIHNFFWEETFRIDHFAIEGWLDHLRL